MCVVGGGRGDGVQEPMQLALADSDVLQTPVRQKCPSPSHWFPEPDLELNHIVSIAVVTRQERTANTLN